MLRYALLYINPLPISNLRLHQEMSTYSILGRMVYTVCPVLLWLVLCPVTLLEMLSYVYHISVYNMSYYINIIVYKCTIFKYKDECENVNTNTHIWYACLSIIHINCIQYPFTNYSLIIYNYCQIGTQKLNWNAQSKCGSLDNADHKASGGNVKVCE